MAMDEIKKKLNLDTMSEDERKKLFKDFVDHGGSTNYTEKEQKIIKNRSQANIRQGTRPQEQRGSSQQKSGKNQAPNIQTPQKALQPLTKDSILKQNKPTFFQKMGIKFFSFVNRVTNLGGHFFHPGFLSNTNIDLNEAMLNMQKMALIILNSKSFNNKEIRHYFFRKFPLYYELLLRINNLKIKELLDSIREKEKTSPSLRLMVHDLDQEIKTLFRILYILLPYKKHIAEGYREGFRILEKKEKLTASIINTYMSRLRRDILYVFEKYMIKLFYAFLQSTNLNFKINSREIPIFLDITDKERVTGMQQELEKEFQHAEAEEKTEGEELKNEAEKIQEIEEELALPDQVKEGMQIIERIDFDNFGNGKDSPYYYYDKKDKVYRIAAILDFFEREYSFLLTGNKVTYYMEHHEGKKFDPKKELNDEYMELNNVMDNIREYSQQIKEISNTEENVNIPTMQKHNLIHKASIQKSKISMSLRAKLANTIFKIYTTLEKIRTNYTTFLADPSKKLYFSDMDKNKKLEGKTTQEAIDEFYQFIAAFHYILTKGQMGGAGNVMRE